VSLDDYILMSDCIFCHIVSGQAPASIVYRDDAVTAFLDIQPVNPGHVLVVPNGHAAYLADLDEEVGARLFRVAMRVAAAVRQSEVWCEGINLFLADGEAAMQEVFHVHLHVIPRFQGDGFGLKFGPDYGNKPARPELDALAGRIASRLA
jgi:histidine triad (HIT) family protein